MFRGKGRRRKKKEKGNEKKEKRDVGVIYEAGKKERKVKETGREKIK